jgi:hypothetical protein
VYDQQAKERQKQHGGTAPGKQANTGGKCTTSDSSKARDAAGAAVGVSGKSIDCGTKVLRQGTPELVAAVKKVWNIYHPLTRIIHPSPWSGGSRGGSGVSDGGGAAE